MTRLELYDYELPEELIAQYPSAHRDESRLLIVDRANNSLADRHFSDLPAYLCEGDVLVLNDSRVIPARLIGEKQGTGAHIELFLLRQEGATWETLARPARRLKPGDSVCFGSKRELTARVLAKREDGTLIVDFAHAGEGNGKGAFLEVLQRVGSLPLPPYIRREAEALDSERYQTIYADEPGSAAAPTAGLHFTEALLAELRGRGVETAFVTLHVGLGTFRPVQTSKIEDHHMHEEFYHIPAATAQAVNQAKQEGRRVICVGTTSVRTLESAATRDSVGTPESAATSDATGTPHIQPGFGSTDIFIYPGSGSFRVTDALITNFHLPKSTLLMLVSAFYNRESILRAYEHAIAMHYRFFSYGDAMLVL
jgi:S-adenosylmethionine:tRNA ribosyltransferase-isomerase